MEEEITFHYIQKVLTSAWKLFNTFTDPKTKKKVCDKRNVFRKFALKVKKKVFLFFFFFWNGLFSALFRTDLFSTATMFFVSFFISFLSGLLFLFSFWQDVFRPFQFFIFFTIQSKAKNWEAKLLYKSLKPRHKIFTHKHFNLSIFYKSYHLLFS